jgi:D-serine deaminase-like pyridoxal phosphate-dependent protein
MQSAASSTTASQWTDIVNKLPVYLMVAAGVYFVGQLMIAKAGRTVIQTK